MKNILLIDKQAGWTSFDVVAKIRNAVNQINKNQGLPKTKHGVKVGHAGTLDPFATGLLIVLVGKETTAKQEMFMKQDKEYQATLRLGFTSSTGDPEGDITSFIPLASLVPESSSGQTPAQGSILSSEGDPRVRKDDKPFLEDIEGVLQTFLGEIEQIPPIYSAIKIDGKRAYKLATPGEKVVMKPRLVNILKLKIDKYAYPELRVTVKCSSGTYIRSLAEDIGKTLGCGAYLTELRRTKIGHYSIADAVTVEAALKTLVNPLNNAPDCSIIDA